MKHCIPLILLLLCISCSKEEKAATIQITAKNIEFIEIRNPIEDIILWDQNTDTIYPNESNKFIFTKVIESPEFVRIKIGKERLKAILLPGKNITISATDSSYAFKGTNKEGMQFLNDVDRPYFSVNESNKFKKDTTTVQIEDKIGQLKEAELEKLQDIINNEGVDAELETILKKEVDYFYALRTAEIVLATQYHQTTIPNDLLSLLDKTITEYPLESKYKFSEWNMYAESIMKDKARYELIADSTITSDSLQKYYAEDKLHPLYYKLIHSYKDDVTAEKMAATYIMNSAKQNKFEKSLIDVFDQFKIDYPNSIYTKYLVSDIEKIKTYYKKIAAPMPVNVAFYKNESVASLKDLMADLKGEQYYVDLWATWCGPCKAEFKYNDTLNALLKEKGYKKLYISLDKPEKREKWKQDIKYFDLSGLHLLASQEFFVDFEKNHSMHEGYVAIPQYLIIDKEGNLVTNNAPRPSQIEELRAFLEKSTTSEQAQEAFRPNH